MVKELFKHPKALSISIVAHIIVLGAFLINTDFSDNPKLLKQGEVTKTVKAQVVNSQQLEEQKRKKQQAQEARRQRELEKKKQARVEKEKVEAVKRQQAEERKRKAEVEKKRKSEAARKKKDTARKLAEAKKKVELKKQQEAEVKRKVEEQKKKELAEAKKKKERLKKLEQEKLAEQKRLEEEKKQLEAEERRLAEQERKRREAELKARLEAEETQRRLSSLRNAYILAIKQKITRNWRQPQESGKMPDCEVRVTQGPGGIILGVSFGACEGGSPTYRLSIENAVYKSDPLPKPGDPALFERDLIILFNPR